MKNIIVAKFIFVLILLLQACHSGGEKTTIHSTKSFLNDLLIVQSESLAEKNDIRSNYPIIIKKKEIPSIIGLKNLLEVRIELHQEYDYQKSEIEDVFIQNSGIRITYDYGHFKIALVTKEQLNYLKSNHILVYGKWEWIPCQTQTQAKTKEVHRDIYANYWKKSKEATYLWSLSRVYYDLNTDNIPEILIPYSGGSGGSDYFVYQITKEGYLSLGSISCILMQKLPTQHNGLNDLMLYWHLSADDGFLSIAEYNGISYEEVKSMPVILEQAVQEKIFKPGQPGAKEEEHPEIDSLQWSSKDDDRYRKLIK